MSFWSACAISGGLVGGKVQQLIGRSNFTTFTTWLNVLGFYIISRKDIPYSVWIGFLLMLPGFNANHCAAMRSYATEHALEAGFGKGEFAAAGLKPDVDYYCAGSGEYALEAILEHEVNGGPSIKATIWKQGQLINAYRDYPAHPKPDARISYEERDYIEPYETLNVEFARGCIFKCTYCSFPLIGLYNPLDSGKRSITFIWLIKGYKSIVSINLLFLK